MASGFCYYHDAVNNVAKATTTDFALKWISPDGDPVVQQSYAGSNQPQWARYVVALAA